MAAQDSKQTRAQILQMTQFILNEAKDKSEEITTKALEEFSIEKFKILTASKNKIRQEFQRKAKQLETQAAIQRSTAINRSRLEKIKCRQDMLGLISDASKEAIVRQMANEASHKDLVTKLITQGLLMLLEDEVMVRCRQSDQKLVESCLATSASEYQKIVATETGASKVCKVALDKATFLPPAPQKGSEIKSASCLGGVMLLCAGGSITIDNTIDARLDLVMEQGKPTIRKLLFDGK
eukprot:gnl/TRDRNA2_/TRDRNA2_181227_c0_seq1.p1 gnl/TRDRNA2_/TRDRNA2_181227_c0~~gnl/TRDRNA2_/TRDRNA2_181227_c0_seq1.p1  ORF type:complete len:238 (+),score=77.17 gnl/TRDRNA2_/TRDRNA2_181227_c0_seq1:87-800(+)